MSSDKFKLPKSFTRKPDEDDDCDRPACADVSAALSSLKQSRTALGKSDGVQCPPLKDELGKSTWALLHTMAAWYPDKPTQEDRTLMTGFVSALAKFYPCTWCAEDFQNNLKEKPVESKSRADLCIWLCEHHNIVNEKLGKPKFKCKMRELDERWRKSNNPLCQSDH